MARRTVDQLQQAVTAVVDARRAVEAKERALVTSVAQALRGLGYRLVPVAPRRRGATRATPRRRARR